MTAHRTIVHQRGHRKHEPAGTFERMPRGSATGAVSDAFADTLRVRCWCERSEVEVPALDVSRGVTASCGRPRCAPPQGREVTA